MLIQNGRVQISITITNKSESFSIQKVIRILFYAEKQAGKLETGFSSRFYSPYKAQKFPQSIIFKRGNCK